MAKHAKSNEYKVEGSDKRKLNYTIAAVISAIILAGLVTFGIITLPQITGFVELTAYLLGVIYAAYELITNIIARKNVEPPVELEPNIVETFIQ